jgi:hypothetical protein
MIALPAKPSVLPAPLADALRWLLANPGAQGDKTGMDLYQQLSANATRKPGALGMLPSDQTGDTLPSNSRPLIEANNLGLQVSDWQTFWIYGLPNDVRTPFSLRPCR